MVSVIQKRSSVGRPERGDDTNRKRLILESAVRLYAKEGFERVTFKSIAVEAGVANSLIRHYFGSKEEFRSTCNRFVLDEVIQVLEGIQDIDNSIDNLNKTINGLIKNLRERSYLLRYLARLFMDGDDGANSLFHEYFQQIRSYIDRLDAANLLTEGSSPVWLSFSFIYMQLGTAFLQDQIEQILGVDAYDLEVTLNRNNTVMNILRNGAFKK